MLMTVQHTSAVCSLSSEPRGNSRKKKHTHTNQKKTKTKNKKPHMDFSLKSNPEKYKFSGHNALFIYDLWSSYLIPMFLMIIGIY